jgi:lipid-A-disaccharide synthase
MKYYIIAGEASGDLHASNLVRELKKADHNAAIRGWGGDLMAAEGVEVVKHYRDLAFMGFLEVLLNIGTILKNLRLCKSDILGFKPDVLILVDYPGFNLRIASFAHKQNIRVIYYISPQVWAWKKGRVKTIRKVVDRMLVILPFEKEFYAQNGMNVDFVGHPLLDALNKHQKPTAERFREINNLPEKPIVALLPGSRKQEVSVMLKEMMKMTEHFPEYSFIVAGAPSLDEAFYTELIGSNDVKIVYGQTYDLLYHAQAALVTSGTATLETALIGTPEVVCYKGNRISYEIARRLIHVRYISLVNLVMDREVVAELIQNRLNEQNLKIELFKLLHDPEKIEMIRNDYVRLREKLGGDGASKRAAGLIYSMK